MFESLPKSGVQYPIVNFPTVPRQPVIPTAEMAAQLAQNATQIAAMLDPNARKQKETELAILGAKLRADSQNDEIRQMQINLLKEQAASFRASQGTRKSTLDKSFGAPDASTAPLTMPPVKPPLVDTGDTDPAAYYSKDLSLKSPGTFQFSLGPQQTQTELPGGDYAGPDSATADAQTPDTEAIS